MKRFLIAAMLLPLLAACASVGSPEYIAHVDGNLWRGSRPADLKSLSQFGKVINLEEANEFVEAERQYALDRGIIWRHYPLSESPFIAPKAETLRTIVADILHDPELPTLIHCRLGKDRTGYAVAAYRVLVNGWEVDAAYEEAKKYGHASFYYAFWRPVLDQVK